MKQLLTIVFSLIAIFLFTGNLTAQPFHGMGGEAFIDSINAYNLRQDSKINSNTNAHTLNYGFIQNNQAKIDSIGVLKDIRIGVGHYLKFGSYGRFFTNDGTYDSDIGVVYEDAIGGSLFGMATTENYTKFFMPIQLGSSSYLKFTPTTAPATDASFGQLYVNSTSDVLTYKKPNGTSYDLLSSESFSWGNGLTQTIDVVSLSNTLSTLNRTISNGSYYRLYNGDGGLPASYGEFRFELDSISMRTFSSMSLDGFGLKIKPDVARLYRNGSSGYDYIEINDTTIAFVGLSLYIPQLVNPNGGNSYMGVDEDGYVFSDSIATPAGFALTAPLMNLETFLGDRVDGEIKWHIGVDESGQIVEVYGLPNTLSLSQKLTGLMSASEYNYRLNYENQKEIKSLKEQVEILKGLVFSILGIGIVIGFFFVLLRVIKTRK